MTDAERKLWWYLRGLLGRNFHFRRQATIGRYFVDFACHQARLVIEVDGDSHAQHTDYDAERTQWLNQQRGYRVLRFWNDEILQNTAAVVKRIAEGLQDHEVGDG